MAAVLIVLELLAGSAALISSPEGQRTPAPGHHPAATTRPQAAPRPPQVVTGSTTADAVRALLRRRARAVLAHDRGAFLRTVDPDQPALRLAQGRLFSDLSSVPFSTWRYDLGADARLPAVGRTFSHYGAPVWAAQVQLVYALRKVDPVPTTRTQYLTFVDRGGSWYFGGDSDFTGVGKVSWRGIWDFGPVVARAGAHCLILAHPKYATHLPELAAQVDDAISRVTAVWGTGWPQRIAVLIPNTQQEMTAVVGGGLDLAHIAAVATADYADTSQGIARGQRVVINPVHLMSLGSLGRPVVLRHELTHVATRTVTGPATPIWLAEGFADYVGYRDTGIAVRVAAQELQIEISRGDVPQNLPADKEFAGDNPRLSQVYEEAWMACRLIARRVGTAGLVRFYRMVGQATGDSAAALERAMRTVLGMDYETFVRLWRADLVSELS